MVWVEGIQISIPIARKQAAAIIGQMQNLLADRYKWRVTRGQFLRRWSKLRKALRLTNEYRELIDRVRGRQDGRCELCGKNEMAHVHHKVRVAMNPALALVDSNCVGVCKKCHLKEHGK